eukprot:UN15124
MEVNAQFWERDAVYSRILGTAKLEVMNFVQ